jgi:hypothetical protein
MKVMKYTTLAGLLVIVGALTMRSAWAETWVYVPDMSQLKYQLYPGGLIYFRNLSDFSTAALGCCYNYSIDTTTQDGRNTWATILSAIAQHSPLYLGIPDGQAQGIVTEVGIW